MAGWHAADSTWWPVISESIPQPWSREAVLMDLRWYGAHSLSTDSMPGRRFFSRRWGWSERRARNEMAALHWWDPEWGEPDRASRPLPRTRGPGLIYAVATVPNHAIKVGWSTAPRSRIADLQTGCHLKLKLIGATEGTMADERALHDSLADVRLHGEWFVDCMQTRTILRHKGIV